MVRRPSRPSHRRGGTHGRLGPSGRDTGRLRCTGDLKDPADEVSDEEVSDVPEDVHLLLEAPEGRDAHLSVAELREVQQPPVVVHHDEPFEVPANDLAEDLVLAHQPRPEEEPLDALLPFSFQWVADEGPGRIVVSVLMSNPPWSRDALVQVRGA